MKIVFNHSDIIDAMARLAADKLALYGDLQVKWYWDIPNEDIQKVALEISVTQGSKEEIEAK